MTATRVRANARLRGANGQGRQDPALCQGAIDDTGIPPPEVGGATRRLDAVLEKCPEAGRAGPRPLLGVHHLMNLERQLFVELQHGCLLPLQCGLRKLSAARALMIAHPHAREWRPAGHR